ncbi:MAG: hypothetical protein FWC79_04580 [Oscillospiraceae bacterium]|nr:hypothetical protein [Oscillospiraceae bacterium]
MKFLSYTGGLLLKYTKKDMVINATFLQFATIYEAEAAYKEISTWSDVYSVWPQEEAMLDL